MQLRTSKNRLAYQYLPSPFLRDLCKTLFRGVFGLIILQRPPLSFGHFPRERGKPDSFAKVSSRGRVLHNLRHSGESRNPEVGRTVGLSNIAASRLGLRVRNIGFDLRIGFPTPPMSPDHRPFGRRLKVLPPVIAQFCPLR